MTKKGEIELIKKINKNLVLSTIRNNHSISRAKLSNLTHLSRSTVSIIVEDLLKEKIIFEGGFSKSTKEGGRKAVELYFNPDCGYGIGIDIGGTKILMIVTNLDGKIIHKEKTSTNKNPKKVIAAIQEFIHEKNIQKEEIFAMGVGVPAVIDSKKGFVIDSPQLGWQNYDFLSDLKKAFSFPVFVNNDVNCGLFGEQWLGSAKDVTNLFFIAIGTGVGSAIISNGNLIEGNNYSAGEVGYFIDIKDVEKGEINYFGSFGAFEKKTSGTFLSSHGISGKNLFKNYYSQDGQAIKIIDEFILHLSVTLANVTSLLNPKMIVIGGGVSESMAGLIATINQKVSEFTPIPVEIKLAHLKGDAGALGSIAYAFQKVQEI
jgi:glucokinase